MEVKLYTELYGGKETISIESPEIMVLSHYVGINEEGKQWKDDRLTVTVNDPARQFWPVIIKVSNEEARKIISAISTAIQHREEGRQGQGTSIIK